jgi:hypothetical protein
MKSMDLQHLKHCICGQDHGRAVLLVDIESELVPRCDGRGNWLYYCLKGHHVFSNPPMTVKQTLEMQDNADEAAFHMCQLR